MKTIFRLLCGWMAIVLTTACSHEELLQIEPLQKPVAQKTISVKAYTPSEQAATRLAFEDKGAEGLKLSWTAGDAFTALIGGEKVRFAYNESSKEFTANVAQDATLTDGVNACYPAYTDEYVKDFSTQTGALNSATTYMEGAYDATAQAFRFTHSTAILKVAFSGLPDGAEIESISVDVISVGNTSQITFSNAANPLYINLSTLAKDSKLVFYVETTAGLYTSTQTVTAEEGIEVGKFYVAPIALAKATVCNLPTGSTFRTDIGIVIGDATSIVFEANSTETGGTQIGSSTAYAKVVGTTLKIYTAAAEFVFNADCRNMFYSLEKIQTIDFGNHINTENVTLMNDMFEGCERLVSLDVSSFNTENVEVMSYMFKDCSALTSLDLSSFNTANVTNMSYMFFDCYALTSLDLSSFNTANVTHMSNMFEGCERLVSLDVSSFNTEKVMVMSYMFKGCFSLSSLDLSSFDFSEFIDFLLMFYNLGENAANQPIPVYVTAAGYNVLSNESTTGIDNSSAQLVAPCELPTGSTFNAAVNSFLESNSSLTKIKFIANNNNTNKDNPIGTSGAYMVAGSDNTLEIHTAANEFVFNASCYEMFAGLSTITAIDFNDCVNTAEVTSMGSIFYGCSALTSLNLSGFNTSNVTNMGSMFSGCSALTSLDLSMFNTSNVTNMGAMFYKCSSLESLDLSGFNTEMVEYMNSMFYDCKKLSSLNVSSFNTANVTAMVSMFDSCSALESLNLSSFNTEKVTSMYNMFSDCSKLTSLDLSSFDFSQVTDFGDMFDYLGSSATNTPIPIYVTQAGYDILKDKNTYYTNRYFQYVDKDGNPY